MIFQTERLYVSRWTADDFNELYQLFDDEGIKELIAPSLTTGETQRIFEEQLSAYENNFPFGRYFIVEKRANHFIGLFLVKENANKATVEIGYSLKKEHWNKGYATEIVQESVLWLSQQKMFSRICAVTELNNQNSQHVLLKSGFIRQDNFVEDEREISLFRLDL